ncbi:hypothetical protein [uncultured Methanobrevibacter sp.]|uniref:hypothetical protein n=1 Tax=uncultured Methanobrevibacter sp. TaxID=253161 RepID=UPI0025E3B327|nr:hypothetical protein [uncultured Methanobrevibacter sp.]MBR4590330.1 hypothetical protein [Bacteroidaceae bacterium]
MDFNLNEIWSIFLSSIDVVYIIMCNIATYAVIKMIVTFRENDLKTSWKRIISTIVAIVLGIVMISLGHDKESVFYGFFIQFLVYDYLWKWIIKKLEKLSNSDDEVNFNT